MDEFVLLIQARTTAGEVANLRRVFRIGQLCNIAVQVNRCTGRTAY